MQRAFAGIISILLLVLGFAGWRTLRADHDYQSALDQIQAGRGTGIAALHGAIRMRPDWADPMQLLAQQMAFSQPQQALSWAHESARLNPDAWADWYTLGMIEYQLDKPQLAWQALQRGLAVNRGFTAHLQSANLALVLGRKRQFWVELQKALAAAASPYHNQLPFALDLAAAHSGGDASLVASILPRPNRERMAEAVEYLVAHGQITAAEQGWASISTCPAFAAADCGQAAATVADALLRRQLQAALEPALGQRQRGIPDAARLRTAATVPQGQEGTDVGAAIALWNRAVQQDWIMQSPAAWGRNTDPQFQNAWLGQAFSWSSNTPVLHQVLSNAGAEGGNEVIFQLDGSEPEQTQLLHQIVPVQPDSRYEVICQSARQGSGTQTGVDVSIIHGQQSLLQMPIELTGSWTTQQTVFETGPRTWVVDLQLVYQRPLGQTLMRTPVRLARLQIQPLQASGGSPARP